MILLTERAQKKFDEIQTALPEDDSIMWDIVFQGFGWGGPRMGLVQSPLKASKDLIEVEGHHFTIAQILSQMIPHYGELLIDFRQSRFSEHFNIRFSRQATC